MCVCVRVAAAVWVRAGAGDVSARDIWDTAADMNTPKWIPKHSADVLELFSDARQLERDLRVLGKKFATNVNLSLPDYYVSVRNLQRADTPTENPKAQTHKSINIICSHAMPLIHTRTTCKLHVPIIRQWRVQ